LSPSGDLHLVRLDEVGFTALGTTRADLIEAGRPSYPTTRARTEAIAVALPASDGMSWYSRQDPTRKAVLLFGRLPSWHGVVGAADLSSNNPALPFALPEWYVCEMSWRVGGA
jgi:hypothetical protein